MTDHIEITAAADRPLSLFGRIEAADPEIAERMLMTRRTAVAAGVALATAPLAVAAMARDAFGQSASLPAIVTGILNYALTLEYVEAEFYRRGVAASRAGTLAIPSSDLAIFTTIAGHEAQHVTVLQQALGGLVGQGGQARVSPTFDFSGGSGSGQGPLGDQVFKNYDTFLQLAQAFEDTGVRAYKGQAPALLAPSYKPFLAAALGIHSVEARHASEVRRLRGQRAGNAEQAPNKGWITGNQTDIPFAQGPAGPYAGEDNTVQGGIDLTTVSQASRDSITEGWDEPLTQRQVLAIAGIFLNTTGGPAT